MVALYSRQHNGATLPSGGVITLNDGRSFDFSQITGGQWNAQKLAKATAALQMFLDRRIDITSLPAGDPDIDTNPNQPSRFWSDAQGSPVSSNPTHITERYVVVTLTHDGSRLIPTWRAP